MFVKPVLSTVLSVAMTGAVLMLVTAPARVGDAIAASSARTSSHEPNRAAPAGQPTDARVAAVVPPRLPARHIAVAGMPARAGE